MEKYICIKAHRKQYQGNQRYIKKGEAFKLELIENDWGTFWYNIIVDNMEVWYSEYIFEKYFIDVKELRKEKLNKLNKQIETLNK